MAQKTSVEVVNRLIRQKEDVVTISGCATKNPEDIKELAELLQTL